MRKLDNEELSRKSIDEFKKSDKVPIIVILDNVRSLNNIGSIFRTCDAFLVEAIYLCGITAKPPHREIQKTALGATESVEWNYFEKTAEAVQILQKKGYQIICIEQTEQSTPLQEFRNSAKEKMALIFGNEVKGVDQHIVDMSDCSIEIPQFGTKHSFNITVSVGIVLWEICSNPS